MCMEFLRQEYFSELPRTTPGYIPDPGIKSVSAALAGRFFTAEPPGKPLSSLYVPGLLAGYGPQSHKESDVTEVT